MSLASACNVVSDPKCLLMAPTEMSFGFVAAMLNGWVRPRPLAAGWRRGVDGRGDNCGVEMEWMVQN